MSIDLTEEVMARAEAVVINHGILTNADAIDLAWDTVRAVLPHIETAVREQIARDIEAKTDADSGGTTSGIAWVGGWVAGTARAARIARGEQP